jgi:predicted ATP-dependent serine protease
MATSFHGREKYILTFIDDFLRKTFLDTVKNKFGVVNNLKVFKALVEKKN